MFLLFLLFSSFSTLRGAPVALDATGASSLDIFCTRDTGASVSGSGSRTTYGIAWSCSVTIFACIWTSGHPNIAGPRDSAWTCLKRRIVTMFCSLIAPEMVACWALRQYFGAVNIAREYNADIAKTKLQEKSFREVMDEWFIELPEGAATRALRQPWTTTHGFFTQMGGFTLYEAGQAKRVLNFTNLKRLIQEGKVDAPSVTRSELRDRSKGDAISKGFVVLQTTWFIMQCLGRVAKKLPLSELEIITLGFAIMNVIVYAVWWNKPQGVGISICVPLKSQSDVNSRSAGELGGQEKIEGPVEESQLGDTGRIDVEVEPPALPTADQEKDIRQEDTRKISAVKTNNVEVTVQELSDDPEIPPFLGAPENILVQQMKTPVKQGWLLGRQMVPNDSIFRWPFFVFVTAPIRCEEFFIRPVLKMLTDVDDNIPADALRMPIFYADHRGNHIVTLIASGIIGIVFGAVHLLAWTLNFPTKIEHTLWCIFALVITVEPIAVVPVGVLHNYCEYTRRWKVLANICYIFINLVTPFYLIARVTLIVLAFLSLRALPPQVHATLQWTSFIPHF